MRRFFLEQAPARGIEGAIPDVVVMRGAPGAVGAFEACQVDDHLIDVIAQRLIAADEIAIAVEQRGRAPAEQAGTVEIEKYGSAAKKRFPVAAEFARVEPAERGEDLPLAARPLEKRTRRRRSQIGGDPAQCVRPWAIRMPIAIPR